MPTVDSPAGWLLALALILFPVAVLLLFLILIEARRLVRATWAMVSLMKSTAREIVSAEEAIPAPRVGKVAPFTGHVKQSMFGR
jgi:hypothetical protein